MTYCLGIRTKQGLVMASDSRTNAGIDQVDVCRKMHTFVIPGERVFVVLSAGALSLTQSVVTLLEQDFHAEKGLYSAPNFYSAVRCVGDQVRHVASLDRDAMERDKIPFSVTLLVGGQIRGEAPELYLVYSQGNPLRCTNDSPYLQIGESKYGRPILDRGLRYESTTLEQASKYALISLDSTMRSNMAVGPPIDLALYCNDEFALTRRRRFAADDPQLIAIRSTWERELRNAVKSLPEITFDEPAP